MNFWQFADAHPVLLTVWIIAVILGWVCTVDLVSTAVANYKQEKHNGRVRITKLPSSD